MKKGKSGKHKKFTTVTNMVRKDIVVVMIEHRPEKDEELSHTRAWRKGVPNTGNG